MEQEREGRLSEGNTLERRYRNHLRDVGLYTGVLDMSAIRPEKINEYVTHLEPIVHREHHLRTAMDYLRTGLRGTLDGLCSSLRYYGGIEERCIDVEPMIVGCRTIQEKIDAIERTGLRQVRACVEQATHYAERARQIDSNQRKTDKRYEKYRRSKSERLGRETGREYIRADIRELLTVLGIPRVTADIIACQDDVREARAAVRAGRYLLRAMRRMEHDK